MKQIGAKSVHACARRPLAVLVVAALLAVGALVAAGDRLSLETDATALIPSDTPFLQTYERYKRLFPYDRRTNIVVIDAPADPGPGAA